MSTEYMLWESLWVDPNPALTLIWFHKVGTCHFHLVQVHKMDKVVRLLCISNYAEEGESVSKDACLFGQFTLSIGFDFLTQLESPTREAIISCSVSIFTYTHEHKTIRALHNDACAKMLVITHESIVQNYLLSSPM
jgi:hypothetical protein